jgi:sugar lactone lactonase YvrE
MFSKGGTGSSILPLGFASQTLSFGAEGIGPGMFQDPRHIGVDSNGNITVADYQDGRIQTFDSAGKFKSGFSIGTPGKKVYVGGMAVGRDGTIYVAHDQKIFAYGASGKQTQVIGDDQHSYGDVVMGADGKLYAIDNQESIVRFKPDGTVDLEIKDTFAQVTGDMDIDTHLAVDGLGNMYLVGAFHYLVLKYSPQGNFIDQFGGEAKDAAINEPGKFTSPEAIAVDGYGRIYVSDFLNIQVFDPSGTYLNSIGIDKGAAFGLAFDDQNNFYVVTNQNIVTKYKVQAPAGK